MEANIVSLSSKRFGRENNCCSWRKAGGGEEEEEEEEEGFRYLSHLFCEIEKCVFDIFCGNVLPHTVLRILVDAVGRTDSLWVPLRLRETESIRLIQHKGREKGGVPTSTEVTSTQTVRSRAPFASLMGRVIRGVMGDVCVFFFFLGLRERENPMVCEREGGGA